MGSSAGTLTKRQRQRAGNDITVVRVVKSGDECGPEDAPRANNSHSSFSTVATSIGEGSPTQVVEFDAGSPVGCPRALLEVRLASLEKLVAQQAAQLREAEQALACIQRDSVRTVSVLQYNILAAYLGQNTQPWFLYGADISAEDRKRIFKKFYERDERGAPKNSWPTYVEGILTHAQIEEVKRQDEVFKWSNRKVRLLEEIQRHDADVLSLVELDHPDYFEQCLAEEWEMVFHKRPRHSSLDGCGVFWRRSKFEMLAHEGFDFIDGSDDKGRAKMDRSCLMVLLKWTFGAAPPLVIVSTHLAKDPDDRSQTAIRVRQVTQLMEHLTEFTGAHGATDAPVILCGDLNARHFGEIRGIARTVWQVTGSQLHKFLWSASDVPTGPTSITKARQCRIDAVQYLASQLEVVEVRPVPIVPKGEVIPSADHPSDHFPVYVRFRLKDMYQKHREVARAWLECVCGREKVHPLTESELRDAFDFFDRERNGAINRNDLEEACLELHSNVCDDVQRMLLECFDEHEISHENFIRAYEARLNHERIRCIGELEYAFEYFASLEGIPGSTTIPLVKLEAAFREITPISFSDEEVKEMIGRLNLTEGQDLVDIRSFCEVVCRASFPHRDRRKNNRMSMIPSNSSNPEDCGGATRRSRSSRLMTKELRFRLDRMNETIQMGPWGDTSPSRHSGDSPIKHWPSTTWSMNGLSETLPGQATPHNLAGDQAEGQDSHLSPQRGHVRIGKTVEVE